MINKRAIMVRASSGTYPVVFEDFRRHLKGHLADVDKIAVISNGTVFALHGKRFVRDYLPSKKRIVPIMIGDGEKYKSQKTIDAVYEHLFDIGMDRSDVVVAFGGGVVGDVAGYAAATFKRGVRLVQAPTTLLSMADSSIGGKTGINHRRGKNLIGAFYPPILTIIDPGWLATLGPREMIEGLAEIIKAGFLSSEKLLKAATALVPVYTMENRSRYAGIIRVAAAFKAKIVARDERDLGIRAVLNFGHTFGHAIEKAEGFRRYHHGEAVLAGMAGALYLSNVNGLLSKAAMRKGLAFLHPYMDRLRKLEGTVEGYVEPMSVDKKRKGKRPVFVLLEDVGRPVIREVGSPERIKDSVKFMIDFVNNRGMM